MHYHVKEIDPLPLTSFCCYSVCSHAAVLVQLMEINCFSFVTAPLRCITV